MNGKQTLEFVEQLTRVAESFTTVQRNPNDPEEDPQQT